MSVAATRKPLRDQPRHAIRWPAGSRTRQFHRWAMLGSVYASQPVFLPFFVWKGRAHLGMRRSKNVEIKLKTNNRISNKRQETKTKQRQTNKRNNQPRTVFYYDLQFTGIVSLSKEWKWIYIYISVFFGGGSRGVGGGKQRFLLR